MTIFLLWSVEHNAWWRANSAGYSVEIWDAGLYSDAESAEILERANLVAFNEARIPVDSVLPAQSVGVLVRCSRCHDPVGFLRKMDTGPTSCVACAAEGGV
jgi:formylmethanofuran dehydrogenase subunit E